MSMSPFSAERRNREYDQFCITAALLESTGSTGVSTSATNVMHGSLRNFRSFNSPKKERTHFAGAFFFDQSLHGIELHCRSAKQLPTQKKMNLTHQ
jgi:hypothetical protein